MIVAATGHRPDKLGGYNVETRLVVTGFAREFLEIVQPEEVISGMAQGWDQAVAWAAVDLGIPFVAAEPFAGHGDNWPLEAHDRYLKLLAHAKSIVFVWTLPAYRSETIAEALNRRNHWMVDNASVVLALWNGTPGGTANCVNYAREKRVEVLNGWAGLQHYRNSGKWMI